jgi:NaMN:DMB phosphoribosyltransferase
LNLPFLVLAGFDVVTDASAAAALCTIIHRHALATTKWAVSDLEKAAVTYDVRNTNSIRTDDTEARGCLEIVAAQLNHGAVEHFRIRGEPDL